ncbi:hypothetical protein SAMN04487939_10779 [Lysobacter sp. yr284]|uniref:hypothetical protein n=1 Tax=Lysobacter sp. yr284 TaxID=1761791 RepID=UPI00089BAF3F|nr:hypothetical protein [Lysobacter sp. yr284]SDY86396.1 hypothetical protein SAMN04487939_10779 [Lysobacter sp. yr284]
MTRNAIAKTLRGPARLRMTHWPLLTLALGALTACAQPPGEPAPTGSVPSTAAVDAAAKGQQSVGYDVQGLERRLVNLLVRLESFDDVQPRSVAKRFELKLQPRAKQPLSLEGVGKLSNGWVFSVWAWQSEPNAPPQAPLQLFFYPGGDVDPGLWVDPPCFVNTTGMLAQLHAAGYTVLDELSNFPFHSVQLRRTTSKVDIIARVGDYQMLSGPLEDTRCLRDLTVTVRPASSPR